MSKLTQPLLFKTHLSVIAVVTVLALLAIPICAPLCAVNTCSSHASNEHCHEMASMAAGTGEHFIAPTKSCGSSDFSAVLVKIDEQAVDSHEARNALSAKILGVRNEQTQPGAFRNSPLGRAHHVPLALANSPQLSAVLRI
jgi:hypothetical protein